MSLLALSVCMFTIIVFRGSTGLSMALSAVTIAASFLWFQCSACGCVQDKSVSTRARGERAGKVVLGVCTALMAAPTPFYLHYVIQNGLFNQFLLNFVITKSTGIVIVSVLQSVGFYMLWRCQKSNLGIRDCGCCWCKRYYIEYAQEDAQHVALDVCGFDISGQALGATSRSLEDPQGTDETKLEAMQLVPT